jgi:hypothetical protein
MAIAKFQFGPQPALDKAIATQKLREEAVVAARRALEEEKRKLQRLIEEVEKTRQRIRTEHDKLVSPGRGATAAADLTQDGRFLDSLRAREKAQLAAVAEQRGQVTWAKQKLDLRKKELAEALAAVQALERLKEKRRLEHQAAARKAEESRRDDDAIQLWNNRPD